MTKNQVPTNHLIAYSLPVVSVAILHAPALSVLPALYAKHAGIDIAVIGLILMLARTFDAVTDPMIGYLSDRTRSRFGQRKPWILAGALVCTVAVYFQFRPGPETGVLYFIIWSFALSLGWTLVEIPHTAWLSDLTHDYDQKTRAVSYRTAAGLIGGIMFSAAPLLPLFATTEMTPEVTAFMSWVVMATLLPFIIVALRAVPQGRVEAQEHLHLKQSLKDIASNRPFQIFFTMSILSNLSSGMVGGLYFFFMDAYLGILNKFPYIGLTVSGISLIATAFWPVIIRRLEKHRAMALCNATVVLTLIGMAMLRPGPFAFPGLAILFGVSAFFAAGSVIATTSLLADVIDYDTWKTHKNKAANYFAFLAFSGKIGVAVGGGTALFIVGLFGFSAQGGNGQWAMTGFFLSFIIIPIILNSVTVLLALKFPINRAQQMEIQQELKARLATAKEAIQP